MKLNTKEFERQLRSSYGKLFKISLLVFLPTLEQLLGWEGLAPCLGFCLYLGFLLILELLMGDIELKGLPLQRRHVSPGMTMLWVGPGVRSKHAIGEQNIFTDCLEPDPQLPALRESGQGSWAGSWSTKGTTSKGAFWEHKGNGHQPRGTVQDREGDEGG